MVWYWYGSIIATVTGLIGMVWKIKLVFYKTKLDFFFLFWAWHIRTRIIIKWKVRINWIGNKSKNRVINSSVTFLIYFFFLYKWRSLPSSDMINGVQIEKCSKPTRLIKKSSSYNDINIYKTTLEDNFSEDVRSKSCIFPWGWFSYSKLKGPDE